MDEERLIITCEHVVNRTREGEFDKDGDCCLCSECWKKMGKLTKKYGDDVPIEKLDFVFTACETCVGI